MESSFRKSLGGTSLAVTALLLLLSTIFPSSQALAWDENLPTDRIVVIQNMANEQAIIEPQTGPSGQGSKESNDSNGSMGEEGKIGTQDSQLLTSKLQVKKRDASRPTAIATSMSPMAKLGILGALQEKNRFQAMLSSTELMNGYDEVSAMGNRSVGNIGDPMGQYGLGFNGFGPGGGSNTPGTIGVGDLGQRIGTPKGHDDYNGPNRGGSGNGPRRKANLPKVGMSTPTVGEGLDKETIRRYVRGKLRRIRHCYEKNLVVEKNLAGTVVAWFQVNPQGKVVASKASGLGNQAVESCVAKTIQSITFPVPKNGSMVNVKYPFHMSSASE